MRRKSKTLRTKLEERLDELTSKIIRQIEPACVVCGSTSQLGAGHIFSRKKLSMRWDLRTDGNVHTQCWPCNFRHVRDQYPYFNWYIKKFGQERFDELRAEYMQVDQIKTPAMQEKVEELEAYGG